MIAITLLCFDPLDRRCPIVIQGAVPFWIFINPAANR